MFFVETFVCFVSSIVRKLRYLMQPISKDMKEATGFLAERVSLVDIQGKKTSHTTRFSPLPPPNPANWFAQYMRKSFQNNQMKQNGNQYVRDITYMRNILEQERS